MFYSISNSSLRIVFGIIIGLVLFLTGIKIMTNTFESLFSNKIKSRFRALTSNKLLNVFIGILITSLLHSSSATTLIVIGLVHGGLITLSNSIPIIMGANIGTTLTAQLIAFKGDNITNYLFIIGIVFYFIFRKTRYKGFFKVIISLGIVFLGMDVITLALMPLRGEKWLASAIIGIEGNTLLGIFVGTLITAVIQSSSAGIGILQIMSSSKIISVSTAIPIILGQNIGTCLDTLIGSLSSNKLGKRVAFIHILFNIAGVAIFYFLTDYLYILVKAMSPGNPARQIANAHSIFNILTTVALLPFSSLLLKLSQIVIKE